METDGEWGGRGEAERRGRSELGRLLEALKSSEALEKRIPLIKQLEDSYQFSADDLGLILQGLLASWIDSTCSGVSHCTLHRSILQVALKCSELDTTDYMGQFLTLGVKASSWCRKHLQRSVKCIDESQVVQEEEHDRLHLEINSMSFSICTKLLGVAAKCFTVLELEVAAGEGGQVCLLNKADDEFPTLNSMASQVERRAMGLRTKRVRRMAPWSLMPVLSPPPQEALRRWCTHCGPEKTPQWRPGLAGPGTLCNVCGHRLKDSAAAAASWTNTLFREGRLMHSNSRRRLVRPSKKRRHSSKKKCSAAGNVVGASLDAFFDRTVSGVSREPEPVVEKELEWLDAFPMVKTMAAEVNKAPALDAPRARTKGRRRVTAMETTCRQANVPHGDLRAQKVPPVRRCTHCGMEKAPQWRMGPEGPRTLCNACGLVFKKGRLLPEYRPANSPAFSPLLHSNTCRGALEMHRQKETTSAACHGGAPSKLMQGQLLQPANGPASSSPLLHSNKYRGALEMRRQSETTSAACHGGAPSKLMEGQLLQPANRPASSLLQLYSIPEEPRQSEEVTSAAGRAASKASHGESMEVQQPFPEYPPADRPAFSLVYHRRVFKCRRKSKEETLVSMDK